MYKKNDDYKFYIDGRKCNEEEFLDRVKIFPPKNYGYEEYNEEEYDESLELKLEMIDDILEIMNNCRTESSLVEDLLDYFDGVKFEIE